MQTIPSPPTFSGNQPNRTQLTVNGMSCSNCVRHVTEALQAVNGVASAVVSLEDNRATIRWGEGHAGNASHLVQAVKKAGYQATLLETPPRSTAEHGAHKESLWSTNVLLGTIPTALLMIGDWVLGLSSQSWYGWTSFVLASLVQFGPGRHFYRGAWNQLKVRSSNMDTLVALGSTTAFVYSVWALLSGASGHLYFMEAAAIISLISAGHWMEARVSARASSSLKALMHLAPETATLRALDGTEHPVAVSELKPGDIVVLKPGDRVPTDGEVIEGHSAVDESMLTGESMPVEKTPGSKLYAGTVGQNGRLVGRVTSVGDDTALAHIVSAVERAQTSRANIQRLGDRVSSVFVPVVVLVAVVAALWWGLLPDDAGRVNQWLSHYLWAVHPPSSPLAAAVITAAAVLIIACPCAMGLATPAAIMAAANAAARRGILIRDGVALEKAGQVTAVLFDKTGTLTAGTPKVTDCTTFNGTSASEKEKFIQFAATLATRSNHPLSHAVGKLKRADIPLTDWREVRGSGVEARLQSGGDPSHSLRLGSLRWLEECGVTLSKGERQARELAAGGASVLGLAEGQALVLLVALKDTIKPGAARVVQRLQHQGLKTYLITGDNRVTAGAIATQAGIPTENVFAEVRPEQKAEFVKMLQERGERVAFVGDGINDAPALEQADLGIAVSRASDIAREAADIVLLRSEIDVVPESLGLARATLRTIKQNLFWAFFYNALGVPLAALGFMSPVLCAAAMGISDLVVIGNALRLRRWKLS